MLIVLCFTLILGFASLILFYFAIYVSATMWLVSNTEHEPYTYTFLSKYIQKSSVRKLTLWNAMFSQ